MSINVTDKIRLSPYSKKREVCEQLNAIRAHLSAANSEAGEAAMREFCDQQGFRFMIDSAIRASAIVPGEQVVTFKTIVIDRDGNEASDCWFARSTKLSSPVRMLQARDELLFELACYLIEVNAD